MRALQKLIAFASDISIAGKCLTPTQLLICSSFSRENGHLLLICSSLSTSQIRSTCWGNPEQISAARTHGAHSLLPFHPPPVWGEQPGNHRASRTKKSGTVVASRGGSPRISVAPMRGTGEEDNLFFVTLPPIIHHGSGKWLFLKGNYYWRYTHVPLNYDCGRKGRHFV